MVYVSTIPNPGDTLAGSQPQIRGNFSEINTDFARNHVALTDATVANRGKHNVVEFNLQVADPVLIATEGELYTKAVGGTTEMFWKRFGGNAVRMTAIDPAYTVVGPALTRGVTFLPGGLLLQYGLAHANGHANTTIAFATAFSAAPYSINVTFSRSTGSSGDYTLYVVNAGTPPTANNFTVYNSNGGHDFYYMAIGPA